jgi:hypothetical protein
MEEAHKYERIEGKEEWRRRTKIVTNRSVYQRRSNILYYQTVWD